MTIQQRILISFGLGINVPEEDTIKFMPPWLANVLPSISEHSSLNVWPATAHYVNLARRWHVLGDYAWRRVWLRFMDETLEIVESFDTRNVVQPVRNLISRELKGEVLRTEEWQEAKDAALKAFWSIATETGAEGAAGVAWVVATGGDRATEIATEMAVSAVMNTTKSESAEETTWNWLTISLFTIIEEEIDELEEKS